MPQTSTPHPTPTHADSAHVLWPCAVSSWLFAVASGRTQRAKSTRCFWIIICEADKDKSSLERFQHTLSEATLGDSFWIHSVFLKSFCDIQGMLHWNSFQSYCVDPWSGCCSGLPGTFWLCRWSAKWVVVAGFGVDVLLVSNWLDVFANIGTESSIAIRRITRSNVCGNISGDIACVSWLHLVMSVCHFKIFPEPDFQSDFATCVLLQSSSDFRRPPGAQKTVDLSARVRLFLATPWQAQPHSRGSESAAQRSVSLDFNVGVRSLSAGSHARSIVLNVNFMRFL